MQLLIKKLIALITAQLGHSLVKTIVLTAYSQSPAMQPQFSLKCKTIINFQWKVNGEKFIVNMFMAAHLRETDIMIFQYIDVFMSRQGHIPVVNPKQ